MKAHLITLTTNTGFVQKFAASAVAARKIDKDLMKSSVDALVCTRVQIEVPKEKSGLLVFLNAVADRADLSAYVITNETEGFDVAVEQPAVVAPPVVEPPQTEFLAGV